MVQIFEYYERFQGVRGRVTGLPAWARFLLSIVAIPGVVLVGLSILALVVSILLLLLLTVPVYRLLRALTGSQAAERPGEAESAGPLSPGRRHVDVTIIEEA